MSFFIKSPILHVCRFGEILLCAKSKGFFFGGAGQRMERQTGKFNFGSRNTPSLVRPRGLLHAETTQKLPFFSFLHVLYMLMKYC